MNNKLFIEDIQELSNKLVKVRVDFNVPIAKNKVENLKRIKASLPTIKYLLNSSARVVLLSHLGRPDGIRNLEYSLAPVANELEKLLGQTVGFVDDCIGDIVDARCDALKPGEIILLENLRFYKEETANDKDFAKKLAARADIFINDAFGTAHRAHASTQGITDFVSQSACGYLLKKEMDYLGNVIQNPARPFVVISGGAKISDKISMIENMLPLVDQILIGGAMTYTFLKARGWEIGKSLLEEEKVSMAAMLLEKSKDKIVLPLDSNCSNEVDFKERTTGELYVEQSDKMGNRSIGLDIGPETIELFNKYISNAKTIIWNGPMGVFEIEQTAKGTFEIAKSLKQATSKGAITIVGGGDSAAAIEKSGFENDVSHISTGGGASLELLEGKKLPGIESLSEKNQSFT